MHDILQRSKPSGRRRKKKYIPKGRNPKIVDWRIKLKNVPGLPGGALSGPRICHLATLDGATFKVLGFSSSKVPLSLNSCSHSHLRGPQPARRLRLLLPPHQAVRGLLRLRGRLRPVRGSLSQGPGRVRGLLAPPEGERGGGSSRRSEVGRAAKKSTTKEPNILAKEMPSCTYKQSNFCVCPPPPPFFSDLLELL